jgi:hypothetical protein
MALDLKDTITRRGYCFLVFWAAGILLLYGIGGYFGVRTLQDYRSRTEQFRQAAIEETTTEPGAKAPGVDLSPGGEPVDVLVGIYVNHIGEFSLKEGTWAADFDIWFRWTDGRVEPGENFQVVNGRIDHREKREAYTAGGGRYERYRVSARFSKLFDPSRFPFSDDVLIIQVEDGAHQAETLRYVVDQESGGINHQGIPQVLKVTKSLTAVKLHSYGSGRGDPRVPAGSADVHSRFIFAMFVSIPSSEVFIMLFQTLFASVAIAFIVFFIKPIFVDPRFGLGVGAVFAAVGNNIWVVTMLPQGERISLTNMVNAIGFGTIFLTLVQSAISLYIEDSMGCERLRRCFDKVSFVAFLIGYGTVNLMLPLAAKT